MSLPCVRGDALRNYASGIVLAKAGSGSDRERWRVSAGGVATLRFALSFIEILAENAVIQPLSHLIPPITLRALGTLGKSAICSR